jgi:hypothetical protein
MTTSVTLFLLEQASSHAIAIRPDVVAQPFELAERLGLNPVAHVDSPDRGSVATVSHPISLSATPASYRQAPPLFVEPKARGVADT